VFQGSGRLPVLTLDEVRGHTAFPLEYPELYPPLPVSFVTSVFCQRAVFPGLGRPPVLALDKLLPPSVDVQLFRRGLLVAGCLVGAGARGVAGVLILWVRVECGVYWMPTRSPHAAAGRLDVSA
jgi:hypothetical protein